MINEVMEPKLRFNGFEYKWTKTIFSNISSINDGVHQTPRYVNSGIPFISVENLKDLSTDKFITEEDFNKDFKNNRPEKNDIFMSRIGTIGTTAINNSNKNLSYYVSVALIKPHSDTYSLFLMYLMNSVEFQNELWRKTLHVAFPKKINKNEIGNIKLCFPVLFDEQQKIGSFFEKIDRMIELLEKKIDHWNSLKKGYLQKLFVNDNSNEVPQLRFNGFEDKWGKYSFDDIFDVVTDYVANGSFESLRKNISSSNINGFAYLIRLQDASNGWKGPWLYTDEKGYNFLGKSRLFPGDIIMSNVGSVGKFFQVPKLDKPMTLAPNAVLIKSNSNNQSFLYQMMITSVIKNEIMKKTTPGIQLKINKTDFKKINSYTPVIQEQQKIGFFFEKLDRIIELNEQKLDHLKQLKKGYLQNMFC